MSGNGSWRDCAFDAIALVSFEVGRGAGLVAERAVPAAVAAARVGHYRSRHGERSVRAG